MDAVHVVRLMLLRRNEIEAESLCVKYGRLERSLMASLHSN